MLNKLLKVAPFTRGNHAKPVNPPTAGDQELSSALRIVHAGGMVEHYYMAVPAVRILEKYPSYVLAKPEVFKRPWDSVVRPEKILTPGRKFLLVPSGTVKKLRRRVRKPSKELSFVSRASIEEVKSETSGSFISGFRKRNGITKHVTFAGVDHHMKQKTCSGSSKSDKKGKHKKTSNCQSHALTAWNPSLASVDENHDN